MQKRRVRWTKLRRTIALALLKRMVYAVERGAGLCEARDFAVYDDGSPLDGESNVICNGWNQSLSDACEKYAVGVERSELTGGYLWAPFWWKPDDKAPRLATIAAIRRAVLKASAGCK